MTTLIENYNKKSGEYYAGVRLDIIPLVSTHRNRVLEIGCGSGGTLAYLKDNGYCNWTCGVDLSDNALASATEKVDLVYQGNIEEMLLPIAEGSIDMILCLDVLEHLVNPQAVVAYLHTLLAPGGIIISSIPNVRHYTVSIPLIFQNKWEYTSQGVLDDTHLRFFVKDSAASLMQSSGLKLKQILPFHLGLKGSIVNKLSLGIFESFLALQYLVCVENT